MVTAEDLAARARVVSESPDLSALRDRLRRLAEPLLQRMPPVPEHKALLSIDGGVCPEDHAMLRFDPWNATDHRCPRCGKVWRGERHDRNWARFQHLWLAERAAHLAALAALGDEADRRYAPRAREILTTYGSRYWRFPNRDNVLGPSRLFFSTYLESIWITNYLAAAVLLRSAGALDAETEKAIHQVTEEAATLIGDYDEGFSNRQTWNNAALAAVAVWFEDEELARRAIEGDTGLIAHLVRGYGRDGMWYEGENYHMFALRGLLVGAGWARMAGVDISTDERLAPRLQAALLAPSLTALPDFTAPARKDSRFGVSLAQPAYLELWEVGFARLSSTQTAAWLDTLYREARHPVIELFESYLHDAPMPATPVAVTRASLSWWSLLEMAPALEPEGSGWKSESVLLESQGVAVLRHEDRYVSIEAGPTGGGHGHPDHLHLTLHADGVHWLPDPGTGRYVTRDLFWYRSTLAHNAPRLDGESHPPTHASCECFDVQDGWGWVRGRFNHLNRIVMAGPGYVVDVTDLSAREEHLLELAWHIQGRGAVETPGRWVDDALADEFVTRVQRFVPDAPGPIVLTHEHERARLRVHLVFEGALLEMEGPGLPGGGQHQRAPFYLVRAQGRNARVVAVLEPYTADATVRGVQVRGDTIEITAATGLDRHRFSATEWTIEQEGQPPRVLRGARAPRPPFVPLLQIDPPVTVSAPAFRVGSAPPLDGSLDGFELSEPLQLSLEDQYRRSEDGYPGPDDLSATAFAGWDDQALYLAVEVTKPELCLRPGAAAPLELDNDPDDIHSDGLQVYLAPLKHVADQNGDSAPAAVGHLVVPELSGRGVRSQPTSDTRAPTKSSVTGAWRRTERGYCVTIAVPWPDGLRPHAGARVGFDLIVNELLPERTRRVGQLVWSGGGGWVWLRGDRQDPSRFGVLELVG
ncbi:MAG TPA: heparinase II/III family protein [Gemmatimonadales bacterium]|nr:heparinase II/III family protein [Gemmatimonadales bacterium]